MKNKILLICAIAFLALPASLWAVDINGNWIVQKPRVAGILGVIETAFSFKMDGTKLTGTVTHLQGETAISEGKINGSKISFVVMLNYEGFEMKMVYKGTVALNEIIFTREVQGVRVLPQEFIAKREFQRNQDVPLRPIPVIGESAPYR